MWVSSSSAVHTFLLNKHQVPRTRLLVRVRDTKDGGSSGWRDAVRGRGRWRSLSQGRWISKQTNATNPLLNYFIGVPCMAAVKTVLQKQPHLDPENVYEV